MTLRVNLDMLRRYLPDAAVDRVYLAPPFNSNRDYNVVFRDESGNATDAQLLAFEDTQESGNEDLNLGLQLHHEFGVQLAVGSKQSLCPAFSANP